MTEKEKKALIDTYALYLRMTAAGAKSPPVALMGPEQAAGVEACIKEAAKMMTPLERFALQGRIEGLSGSQMAEISGYGRLTIYQAFNSAIQKIDFDVFKED